MPDRKIAILRPMTEQDLDHVLSWRNRESVRQNMYTSHIISPEEHQRWWEKQHSQSSTRLLIAMIDGQDVGVVSFTDYSGEGGKATWAFYAAPVTIRGVGSMMETAALEYAFSELKVRKLECEVLDFNMPVIKLHMKHGFRVEGIFRDAYKRDNNLYDIYRLALMERDWAEHIQPMLDMSESGRPGVTGRRFTKTIHVDSEMVAAFSEPCRNKSSSHFDDSEARRSGFPEIISREALTASLLSGIFSSNFPGNGTTLLYQAFHFLSPVPLNADVTVDITVLSQFGRRLVLRFELQSNKNIYVRGEAEVLAPESFFRIKT